MVLMPAHALSGAKGIFDFRYVLENRIKQLISASQECGAVFHRQSHGLLGRHRVSTGGSVVFHVAARRICVEPLAQIALIDPGAFRQFGRRQFPRAGHLLVKAEPIPDKRQ